MRSWPATNRDLRAVSRDIDLLERFGLLRSRYETNPGHGKRRIVEYARGEVSVGGYGMKAVRDMYAFRSTNGNLKKTIAARYVRATKHL